LGEGEGCPTPWSKNGDFFFCAATTAEAWLVTLTGLEAGEIIAAAARVGVTGARFAASGAGAGAGRMAEMAERTGAAFVTMGERAGVGLGEAMRFMANPAPVVGVGSSSTTMLENPIASSARKSTFRSTGR
jgi:hypothetical protein